MDLNAWGLYLSIAAAVMAAAALHYRRNEPAGRGRYVLGALRGAAVAVLVLLLFDPDVGRAGGGPGRGTVALVDASLSMRLPDARGATRWDAARAALARLGAGRVLLFGAGGVRGVDDLDQVVPAAPATRLAPALRAALESGATRVVALTDGGIEDADEVRRLLAEQGGRVEVRRVGADVAGDLAIDELEVPAWLPAGEEATVRVGIGRAGGPVPESVSVALRREGRVLAAATVATPPEGRVATAALRFTPRAGSAEPVRLVAELTAGAGGDAEQDDDRRAAYVRITDRPAGVVLVSFRPGQEARFLLPVLGRALGVPVRGWLALQGGRFIRLGTGAEAGALDDEATVRRALEEADLRVVDGADRETPGWAVRAASRGPLLVFPAGPSDLLPFRIGPLEAGDWYVADEVPPSPVAPLLAGLEAADAPPLMALRRPGAAAAVEGAWAPLDARLARRGPARPVLLGARVDRRRVAVALGQGYWRLAFSGGPGRDLYDRLWSAVAGWLLEGEGVGGADAVEPVRRVVPRGAPVVWRVPPGSDSLRVTLQPIAEPAPAEAGGPGGDGGTEPGTDPGMERVMVPAAGGAGRAVLDTTVAAAGGRGATPALPPGRYRYEARAWGAGEGSATAAGEITVESYSPEFTRPPAPVAAVTGGREAAVAGSGGGAGLRGDGRPLHSWPWPYLAVVALLCAEWILRRRWGLR